MSAHHWELVRDIFLARYAGDLEEVKRLETCLTDVQALCSHVPNPEHPERCYKCSAPSLPSVRKCDAKPADDSNHKMEAWGDRESFPGEKRGMG